MPRSQREGEKGRGGERGGKRRKNIGYKQRLRKKGDPWHKRQVVARLKKKKKKTIIRGGKEKKKGERGGGGDGGHVRRRSLRGGHIERTWRSRMSVAPVDVWQVGGGEKEGRKKKKRREEEARLLKRLAEGYDNGFASTSQPKGRKKEEEDVHPGLRCPPPRMKTL